MNRVSDRLLCILAATTLLAGCEVGPDFEEPAVPQVKGYTSQPISNAGDQVLVTGQDIPGEWWKLFGSKPLDDLVERSLQANPNLKAAQAALTVARENTLAQYGAYYPNITGSFSGVRQKTSSQLQPTPNSGALVYNLYTPQVSVSYTPDVFGLNARNVESLQAEEEQAHFAWVATNIALSANVVTAAIQEASLREQIAATQQIVSINTDMLERLRNQFARGAANRLDIAAQESQLAQVSSTLPPLISQLEQQRNLLAVLAGGFPSEDLAEKFELSTLNLPRKLPLSIPSRLVEQRPDVRQAEENMRAANAQIGVAEANRLPNITLTGDVGNMTLAFSQLFTHGSGLWSLGGSASQTLFDGNSLMHRQRAAEAAYSEAQEQYRNTVLIAFQNVADTLNALKQDAGTLKAATAAKDAASTTFDLTRQQLQSGAVNTLAVLSAEQAYQQTSITLIQAKASRLADTAALFEALGGGWWNKPNFRVGSDKDIKTANAHLQPLE